MGDEQSPVESAAQEKKGYAMTLSGMTCGACEKVIERVVTQNGAEVREIDAGRGRVDIQCPPEKIEAIKQELARRGFRERGENEPEERGDPRRILAYLKSVVAGEPHVEVESRLLNYALGATALLAIAGALSYGAFIDRYGSPASAATFIFFIIGSAVMSVYAISHMDTYRKGMSCSNGMMIGMTTGMVSGYMIGALIGATNGMFIGSVTGTAAGIFIGLAIGRHSGVMGAMEGVMAGLMSGTMGAMTTVMMINDNLLAFLYILSGICLATTVLLSYMMFREAGPAPRQGFRGGFAKFVIDSGAISAIMMLIIFYGPKGGLVFGQ
ncbi:MAG TPA: heavy metal-associated domain-containing protein [Candidatus Bilamarchaeum sp.]|nr:heavy metal-associated domain-containing protein [Candidatus Bilamarchaeum sp.]